MSVLLLQVENPIQKYNPHTSAWLGAYAFVQFHITNFMFMTFAANREVPKIL